MPLKTQRRKGSPYWQITGTVAGERIRESARTADRRLAEEAAAERERELYRGAVYGPEAVVTWAKAVADYTEFVRPLPRTAAQLLRLTDHFARTPLRLIDQAAVQGAIRALCPPGAKPATWLRQVITPIRAVMRHAGLAPRFRTPPGSAGEARTRWLTPEEFRRLHDAAAPHLSPLLVFLICTGARLSEALYLQWLYVDLDRATARMRVKARHGEVRWRTAALPPAAVAALAGLPGREGAVFRTDDGAPYADNERRHGGQIGTAWDGACRRAGLGPDVTPHVLRHSYASYHYALHRDLLRLREEGGWASVRMVERYAKLVPPGMEDEIRQAWGLPTKGRAVA